MGSSVCRCHLIVGRHQTLTITVIFHIQKVYHAPTLSHQHRDFVYTDFSSIQVTNLLTYLLTYNWAKFVICNTTLRFDFLLTSFIT